jgi:branched-subunit amino acid aminotransferase/4-amino-4-deoxychorismate lyase
LVQVTLFSRALRSLAHGCAVEPDIMVSVSPPDEPQTSALRVRCADYERETPKVKHLATYGLLREVRAARTAGFDDVIFVDRTGLVSEGSTWNVCFHDGHQWVWPDAPALRGVTMQLLQTAMREGGVSRWHRNQS